MFDFYTVSIMVAIFAMFCMLVCVYSSGTLTKKNKQYFKLLFIIVAVAAFCECLGVHLNGTGSATRILHTAAKAVELSIAPGIAVVITLVIENKHHKGILLFLAAHSALEIASAFFGFIYRVDANSNYTHESLYWIYTAVYMLSILYAAVVIVRNMRKYQYNGLGFVTVMSLFMLFGIAVQIYDSSIKIIFVSTAIASIMLYVFTLEMVQQNDALTGLINRRGYENYIAHVEEACVILTLDVDNFKLINDKYGHQVGDKCLTEIGTIIKAVYAKYGKCFRTGGDEFCVIVTNKTEQIESINAEFTRKLEQGGVRFEWMPQIAIGYVYFNPQADSIQDSLQEADKLMYINKKAHKNPK